VPRSRPPRDPPEFLIDRRKAFLIAAFGAVPLPREAGVVLGAALADRRPRGGRRDDMRSGDGETRRPVGLLLQVVRQNR
jgi:hypothetical protein